MFVFSEETGRGNYLLCNDALGVVVGRLFEIASSFGSQNTREAKCVASYNEDVKGVLY